MLAAYRSIINRQYIYRKCGNKTRKVQAFKSFPKHGEGETDSKADEMTLIIFCSLVIYTHTHCDAHTHARTHTRTHARTHTRDRYKGLWTFTATRINVINSNTTHFFHKKLDSFCACVKFCQLVECTSFL